MKTILYFFVSIICLGCISSVSNKHVQRGSDENGKLAKEILNRSWIQQGWQKSDTIKTYEVVANNNWKGFIGKIGTVWPKPNIDLNLKYAFRTFDGKVTFLNGKAKGEIHGLQSWHSYKFDTTKKMAVFEKKMDKKIAFGLSAFQYFFELTDRMKNVEILKYGGEQILGRDTFHLVFATWGKIKKHKNHDQYMMWINKETNLLEYCEFTVHDPLVLGGGLSTNTIYFSDYKSVSGIKIPFEMTINIGKPTLNKDKFVHKLKVKKFNFNTFSLSELYPDSTLPKLEDSKAQ